jgi:hypothetical protein
MREPLTASQMKDPVFGWWRYLNWFYRMNDWIRQRYDIGPCCKVHEWFPGYVEEQLKRKLLWDDKGSAEVLPFWIRWIRACVEIGQCCRLYFKLTYSPQDARECFWHILAHRRLDERCEYCHYRRCVREGIGMGW